MQWKGRNDIAYSYEFPVEKLRIERSGPSTTHRDHYNEALPERMASPRPEMPFSQIRAYKPVDMGAVTADNLRASSVAAIKEIDQLLQKAEDVSRSVPSISAGRFPDGHGPVSDVVKKACEFDASALDNLRNALSFVRKGFCDLGKKQELFFSVYGKGDQDAGHSGLGGLEKDDPVSGFGIGQTEKDAEVRWTKYELYWL